MTATAVPPGALRPMDRLLRPRSVAVVGASATPGALGASVIANLDRMKYSGAVYLINPKRDDIGGRRCLKSVDELPPGVDVAVLAIPKAAVLPTVQALARRQVGAAIIFSAGFAEGGDQGLQEQRELARIAADSGMVIEGPNCLGLVNYVDNVALTFVETRALPLGSRPGIGIVSQSGAMACVLGVMLTSRDLGISYLISTGNEAASGVEDYVEFMLGDASTRAIGMIVEQFRKPRRFLELAARARAQGKLIVLLHPGRSSAARESAATHTGAMAGDYQVMRMLVERQGVVVAENLEELGDIVEIAIRCPALPAGGTVMLTESGAFKALTLDLCEQIALDLPKLSDSNSPLLRAALPPFVAVGNPLDMTAQPLVEPDLYGRTLTPLLEDDRFGCVVLGIIQTDATTSNIKFPAIIAAIEALRPSKPVIFAGLDEGAQVPADYISRLRALSVPYFRSADRAMRAVARLNALSGRDFSVAATAGHTGNRRLPDVGVVAEYRAKSFLAGWGIPFPEGRFVTTLVQAQEAASHLGYPLVLKAQSADLSHKSDAGGVVLGLGSPEELEAGWQRLHANVAHHRPGLALDGVLIERMGKRGVELIIGARNDREWGPVILAGFGGVQAEILKDVRLLPPDLTIEGIVRELMRLKSAALLSGFRGSPALDLRAVAELIANIGRLLLAEPVIREIDLNPVVVYPETEGVVALDALMLLGFEPSPAIVSR